MGIRLRTAVGVARHVGGLSHRFGRASIARDLDAWLRLEVLGVASQTGIAAALRDGGGTAADIAQRAGLTDVELTEAFLRVAVSLGEVRERRGRFSAAGRRLRAIASGDADDASGLAEEVLLYDSPIYQRLSTHLRGEPPADYLAGVGAVVARASRLAEHIVGPFLAAVATDQVPSAVLDIGCGTGVNLGWIGRAQPRSRLTGIDLEPAAVAEARDNLARWAPDNDRHLEVADLEALPKHLLGPYDLVLLAQNIYYWPPAERADVLARIRALSSGLVVAISATPGRLPVARNLDLVMRVTKGTSRLPTRAELRADAAAAGFERVEM